MNTATFNAWLIALGYTWVGDEQMVKGFMNKSEAQSMINQLVGEGSLQRG